MLNVGIILSYRTCRRISHADNLSLLNDDIARTACLRGGEGFSYAITVFHKDTRNISKEDQIRFASHWYQGRQPFVFEGIFRLSTKIRCLGHCLERGRFRVHVWGCNLGDPINKDLFRCCSKGKWVTIPQYNV